MTKSTCMPLQAVQMPAGTLLLTALWLGRSESWYAWHSQTLLIPDQPFTITISARNPSAKTKQTVEINIRLTNTSNHAINASHSWARGCGVDQSYTYDIRDASGRLAEILPEIKARREREGRIRDGHNWYLESGRSSGRDSRP